MEEKELKNLADRIIKNPTKVMGVVFKTHNISLVNLEGKEAPQKVEKKMAELGYPLKFSEIKTFNFYPLGLADLVVVVAKYIFSWDDKKVFEMGKMAPQYSFIAKVVMRYFLSIKQSFLAAPSYWRKHFTKGTLEPYFLSETQKKAVLRLKTEMTCPTMCVFYRGYFQRIVEFIVRSKKITVEETKCTFRGDPFHEFTITWE